MKKFKFKLESLYKVRSLQEEQTQQYFSTAVRVLNNELIALEALKQKLSNAIAIFSHKQQAFMRADEMFLHSQYIDTINISIKQQNERVHQAKQNKLECLKKLIEAMKQRKSVEILRKEKYKQYNTYVLSEEQKYLDEIAGRR